MPAINCFYSLAFVPIGFIQDAVKSYLKPLFEKTLKDEPFVQSFFMYLQNTYLSEVKVGRKRRNHQGPSFPIAFWSRSKDLINSTPLTNNGAENFNLIYNMEQFSRQNIYESITGMY